MMFSIKNQKGIGIISIIIIIAFVYGGLTFYSYLYPSFDLAKYTPVNYLSGFRDDERKEELEKIAVALDSIYEEERNLPGSIGYCSRIVQVLRPNAKDALSPYFPDGIPQDPIHGGTDKDYFYSKEDKDTYVLLAVLDDPPTDETYNFEGCNDWPGDNIYNYIISNDS